MQTDIEGIIIVCMCVHITETVNLHYHYGECVHITVLQWSPLVKQRLDHVLRQLRSKERPLLNKPN